MIFPPRQTLTGHQLINKLDATVIDRKSASIGNIIKTADKPEHETFVLVTAKSLAFKQYVYKLYSNVDEIQFPANWMNASTIHNELNAYPINYKNTIINFIMKGNLSFISHLIKMMES